MSQLPIAYVDIRFFAHATEDVNKVIEAVQNIIPNDENIEIIFSRTRLEGHYGNLITTFQARIKNKETVKALIKKLVANITLSAKDELSRTINRYLENGSLFIRVNKQAAFKNKIKFTTSDPIHIRIRFRKSKKDDVITICKELGILT